MLRSIGVSGLPAVVTCRKCWTEVDTDRGIALFRLHVTRGGGKVGAGMAAGKAEYGKPESIGAAAA